MSTPHFTIVKLEQGSEPWREWRHKGIGASDASTIMGENRFKSAAHLLQEKRGPARDYGQNAAMARGTELEPEARRLYVAKTGIDVRPACIQSTRYEWLRASLDGIAVNHDAVVEIKCGQSAYRTSPVNHVFVDYENVHEVDLTIIGNKAVSFMLLMGPRQAKLDASLVEKLLEHATSVQLVRLKASGKNALDFALAYYIGRAVAADPTGHFHIISKDTGYDPLIDHLEGKQIHITRHDSFATLPFARPTKPTTPTVPAATPKVEAPAKPKVQLPPLDVRAAQVLEHLRKPSATRPKTQAKLVSFLVTHLGHNITEDYATEIVEKLQQAGHLTIGGKGAVTYSLK